MTAGWFALLWAGVIIGACLLHAAWHYGDVQALSRRLQDTLKGPRYDD